MCHRISKRCFKTPLSACMVKFAVVLAIFLSAECAAGRYEIKKSRGSCLSYGHACWGAHGKRSGSQAPFSRAENEGPSNRDNAKAEWSLSKMISPLDLRYYSDANELDASKNQPEIDDLFTDVEPENAKSVNDWERIREILRTNSHIAPVAVENGRNIDRFIKSPKFLDKRSTKGQ